MHCARVGCRRKFHALHPVCMQRWPADFQKQCLGIELAGGSPWHLTPRALTPRPSPLSPSPTHPHPSPLTPR
eukprot:4236514-Prymnesium_polylepis.1